MNLIKSTSTYSFFVIISRILGYIRDVLIAIYLGSGPIADAFFVAFRIPNTFRRLFQKELLIQLLYRVTCLSYKMEKIVQKIC